MGGVLIYIDSKLRFLKVKSMISGNTKPWSVQLTPEVEIYFKQMKKQDERYQEVITWAGSESNLKHIMQVLGKSKDAQENVKYIKKYFAGSLANLIHSYKKISETLNTASKRIKYLEKKIEKSKAD